MVLTALKNWRLGSGRFFLFLFLFDSPLVVLCHYFPPKKSDIFFNFSSDSTCRSRGVIVCQLRNFFSREELPGPVDHGKPFLGGLPNRGKSKSQISFCWASPPACPDSWSFLPLAHLIYWSFATLTFVFLDDNLFIRFIYLCVTPIPKLSQSRVIL